MTVAILVAGGVVLVILMVRAYGSARQTIGGKAEREQAHANDSAARARFDRETNVPTTDEIEAIIDRQLRRRGLLPPGPSDEPPAAPQDQ